MKPSTSFDTNSINTSFYTQKPALNNITALYSRHHDEPDFDCEFLSDENIDTRGNESIIDPDPDEFEDDYNDKEWDTDLYDPYLEQTYY